MKVFGKLLKFVSEDHTVKGLLKECALNDFRVVLEKSKDLVIVTGAGVSAESGIPTYRDSDGLWRSKFKISQFATLNSFKEDPASVWEFYHYRRELVLSHKPNAAHHAIAECEKWFNERGFNFTLITTNVDGYHVKAGSKNILEIHGSLFETKCTECKRIEKNFDSPICEALKGKELLFNESFVKSDIPKEKLPRCKKCDGLLRPNVVWFNENLDRTVSEKAWDAIDHCDLAIIIGTSSVVYPAALFGTRVAERDVPVAEFNVTKGPYTDTYMFYCQGPATETVPQALNRN